MLTHQWQEDLRFLVSSLERIHPNLYHHVHRDVFQQAAADLAEAIPQLNEDEILAGLLNITALTQDWHTQIISRNLTEKWFPVRIEQLLDGLFITAVSPDYAPYLGSRLLHCGNVSGEQAFETVKGVTAHDNLSRKSISLPCS